MLDNQGHHQPNENARINITERYEVGYWAQKFGVTEGRLRDAVHEAGTSVRAVEEWLKERAGHHGAE